MMPSSLLRLRPWTIRVLSVYWLGSHLWTGTTGSVVKMRFSASSSTATPVNTPPPSAGAVPRTDPTKSDVSVQVENGCLWLNVD